MRPAVLAGIGLLLLPTAANAERRLATSGPLTASIAGGSLCRSSVPITVHGDDAAAFTSDPIPLEKLVAAIRIAAQLECQGEAAPSRFVITGQAPGGVVYRGSAEASQQWAVVGGEAGGALVTEPEGPGAAPAKSKGEASTVANGAESPNSGLESSAKGEPFAAAPVSGDILAELMMAARPDLYRDESVAVWSLARSMPGTGPACDTAAEGANDEFSRAEFAAKATQRMEGLLQAAQQHGPARTVTIAVAARLDEYDAAQEGFPIRWGYELGEDVATWPANNPTERMPLGCSRAVPASMHGSVSNALSRFAPVLRYTGHQRILTLPATENEARALVKRLAKARQGREVRMAFVVEARADADGIAGRVVAARAEDPASGTVLHVYGPEVFTPEPVPAAQQILATPAMIGLAAVRAVPDILDEARLLGATTARAAAERKSYEEAGIARSDPAGAAHVFTVDEVRSRDYRTPATDLVPKMRAFIADLGRGLPEEMVFLVHSQLVYNKATGRLDNGNGRASFLRASQEAKHGVNTQYAVGGGVSADPQHDVLRASSPADPQLDALAAYEIPTMRVERPAGRERVAEELGGPLWPPFGTIYFDRVLECDGFALDSAQAERLARWVDKTTGQPVPPQVRIAFTLSGVRPPPKGGGRGELLARLDYVALEDPEGKQLSRLPADACPLAETVAAERRQATNDASANAAARAKHAAETQATDAAKAVEEGVDGVRDAAMAAIDGKAYGPDVVGLRLGMSFADAEAIIRQHMKVGWVLVVPPLNLANEGKFTSLRIFLRADKGETIALLDQPPVAAGRVLAVRRILQVPKDASDEQLGAALQEKYGSNPIKPSGVSGRSYPLVWTQDGRASCESVYSTQFAPNPKMIEAPEGEKILQSSAGFVESHLGFRPSPFSNPGPKDRMLAVAQCGPEIAVERRDEKLVLTLGDARILAALLASQGNLTASWTPEQQVKVPQLKF
jgi:hypothetical protein